MKKILFPILASVLIAFAIMPFAAGTVFASTSENPVVGFTGVLGTGANTKNAQTVYYGVDIDENQNANPIAWRVIGYNGSGAASASGAATLLSAGTMVQTFFDESGNSSNAYANSTLRKKIEEGYENGGAHVDGILDSLSDAEQGAIKRRTLVHGSYNNEEPKNIDCIAGDADLEDVALWPLSTKEANAVNKSLRIVDPDHPSWKISYWWLRSPGNKDYRAAYVCGDGDIDCEGVNVSNTDYCARPAFYLNLESVLFTSAAVGGKSSGNAGAEALEAQSDLTNSSGEWKVTIKDSNHADFAVSKVTAEENGVSVEYKKAKAGTDEYISAIITDKPVTEADAAIKYYGRIAQAAAANSSVTINTAGKLGENDHLYIFNEQYNGDKKTDYASKLTEVAPVSINGAKVALSKTSFTYNGKVQKPTIKTIKGMKLKEGTDYTAKWSNASSKKAGTYTVTVTGKGIYTGTAKATYKIKKAANTLKIKAKTATVKYSKVKKKAQTLKVSKVIKFTNKGQGAKSYAKVSGNKKITIAKKTGKVTVKKGLKKGTYKVKVKVKAKGSANYKASAWKTVTFTVKVR